MSITGHGFITGFGIIRPYIAADISIPTVSTTAQFYMKVGSTATSVPLFDDTGSYALTYPNSGVTVVTDASRGKVLSFNGSSYISTNYPLPITHTRLFWVKLNNINYYNNTLSTNTRPMWFNNSTYMNFSLYLWSSATISDTLNPITTGEWYLYALTYDGTTAKLYRNGNLDLTQTTTSTQTTDTVNICSHGGGAFLNGYLSNIRMYDTALTQEEILSIYNYENNQPDTFYTGI